MANGLWMYVVYKNPSDYLGRFVVRQWLLSGDGMMIPNAEPYAIVANLSAARKEIPQAGLMMISRFKDDDPVIVEVWL